MSSKTPKVLGSAVLALVASLAGCDGGGPVDAESAGGPAASASPARQDPTLDEEWARAAREEAPGFAGYYLDPSGATVVLLKNPSARPAVEAYVARQHGRAAGAVRRVQWDFAQLKSWGDALGPLFDLPGVYTLDIDEVRNRVRVGVADRADRAAVFAEAARRGVPVGAVAAEVEPAPEGRVNLNDPVRPVQAGFQIYNPDLQGYCTLGFNAVIGGQSRFVTASHCSKTQYVTDGGALRQSGPSDGIIGTELHDRERTESCSADTRRFCRRSDSSIFGYSAGVSGDFGYIARTMSVGNGARGSLVVDPGSPRFTIVAKTATTGQPTGTMIHKVGRTSGWTKGLVTSTCVRISYFNCQWISKTWSEPGDSGSPMFTEPAGADVGLAGLLWGGPIGDWTTTYYSPMSGIATDFYALGTIYVCATGGC